MKRGYEYVTYESDTRYNINEDPNTSAPSSQASAPDSQELAQLTKLQANLYSQLTRNWNEEFQVRFVPRQRVTSGLP
jgi:hypothetical protein